MINLVQALANRYADTVALFQALGGCWWNRSDEQITKLPESKKISYVLTQ
jgi:outer membrane protein TolC